MVTDHKPLLTINQQKLDYGNSRMTRWKIKLSDYQFKVVYKPGKYNLNADALSRIENDTSDAINLDEIKENTNDIKINVVTRAQSKHASSKKKNQIKPYIPKTNIDISFQNYSKRYSSFSKMITVLGYTLRFIENSKLIKTNRVTENYLTIPEQRKAIELLIRQHQNEYFKYDMREILKMGHVNNKSNLKSLNPFIDKENILRVGGRLQNSNLRYDKKYPILLHNACNFTRLLVEYEHKLTLHSGAQALLSHIRNKYWIPNGINLCKKVIHSCVTCFKVKPTNITQFMGDIPTSRLNPSKRLLFVEWTTVVLSTLDSRTSGEGQPLKVTLQSLSVLQLRQYILK